MGWFKFKKKIPVTQRANATKARILFDEIQQKEGGDGTFIASKRWLTLWIDDLDQKRIPLTQRSIAAKGRILFDEIQTKGRWRRDIQCE